MKAAYMPFTYLPESTAHLLFSLVGPVVVYQPLKTGIPQSLSELASQGLVEIRTPMTRDDDRLCAALTEFTEWARLNPGRSTAGPGFFGSRQGEVPFYDENAVNRIRSDLRRYQESGPQAAESEDGFSARLFLALAQENDLTVDSLDNDLDHFKALEKDFLKTLADAGDAGFSRQTYGGRLWRDDPGARLTGQRIRAWARLAMADGQLPNVLITTSRAVVETLLETHGQASGLEKLADISLPIRSDAADPVLVPLLNGLATERDQPSAQRCAVESPPGDAASRPKVPVTLFVAANLPPETFIGRLSPSTAGSPRQTDQGTCARHTLIVLVQG